MTTCHYFRPPQVAGMLYRLLQNQRFHFLNYTHRIYSMLRKSSEDSNWTCVCAVRGLFVLLVAATDKAVTQAVAISFPRTAEFLIGILEFRIPRLP
jgi:hypothetical protein